MSPAIEFDSAIMTHVRLQNRSTIHPPAKEQRAGEALTCSVLPSEIHGCVRRFELEKTGEL